MIQLQNTSSFDTLPKELVEPFTVKIEKKSKNGVGVEDDIPGDVEKHDGGPPGFNGGEDAHRG